MIYLKCIVAGVLAVLATAILTIVGGVVYLSITSPWSQTGSVGWDPISIAGPSRLLVATLGIFLIGFFWEFFSVRSK